MVEAKSWFLALRMVLIATLPVMNSRGAMLFAKSPLAMTPSSETVAASSGLAAESNLAPGSQRRKLSRRAFLRRGLGGLAALGVGGWAWGAGVESKWIEITQVTHRLRRLAAPWDGVRILQLSDIHADSWMSESRITSIVRLANAQKADIVVLTGDYVTEQPELWEQHLAQGLRGLSAPLGVYGVLGNHDQTDGGVVVRRALRASGITELRNQVHTLTRGGAPLHLAGLDDILYLKHDLLGVVAQLPREGASILLAHEPDFADVVTRLERFDVQLSGHSHGGQVRIPFGGPLHVPTLSKIYPNGHYQVGNLSLYTNRGVGMIRPHIRLFCRPEITIHTLRTA